MQEMVIYHNDFNKIKLPNFNEQEHNLLISILSKIKKKSDINNMHDIEFQFQELLEFSNKNLTHKELKDILYTLKDKFFKADFTFLVKKDNLIGERTINLFTHFTIWKEAGIGETYPTHLFFLGDEVKFSKLTMGVNPYFAYLIYEITKNFTSFELGEFINLSGKYTKTLYRLLKQFKNTGFLKMKWDEFLRIMDIPQNYQQHNIDKWILKPAIRELTAERNLFDQKRIPFKGLQYTKIKGKGRGRGGPVIGIEFSFEPQREQNEIDIEKAFIYKAL